MATIYALKPKFQAVLRPAVARLVASGITANQVTTAAMVLSVGWGAVIAATGNAAFALLGLPLVLLLRMALNAIDGILAREHGQASRLGFFLNETGDVVSDAALYLPLMLVLSPSAPLLVGAAAVAMALTEVAGVLGRAAGGSRRYDGPFGKSDRAAYFSILAVAAAVVTLPAWLPLAAIAVALTLSAATVVNRVAASLRETGDG
jgi:CDP-diacylglycerol--glycerol-3-phosphate 3-phosphatidyltransferase